MPDENVVGEGIGKLKERYGPLTGWQWGAIGIGSYVIFRYVMGRSHPAPAQAQAAAGQSQGPGSLPMQYNSQDMQTIDALRTQLLSVDSRLAQLQTNQTQSAVPGAGSTPPALPPYDIPILIQDIRIARTLPQNQTGQLLQPGLINPLTGEATQPTAPYGDLQSAFNDWEAFLNNILAGTVPLNSFTMNQVGVIGNWFANKYNANWNPAVGGAFIPSTEPTSPSSTPTNTGSLTATHPLDILTPTGPQQVVQAPAPAPTPTVTPAPVSPYGWVVQPGQTLAQIAQFVLGDATQWQTLYAMNIGVIGPDPNNLKPGTFIVTPAPISPVLSPTPSLFSAAA